MSHLKKIHDHLKGNTISQNTSEVVHGLIIAPIVETLIFCYLPYQLIYLQNYRFWEVGIASSLIFSLIHLRFGRYFVPTTFFLGLIFWTIMVKFGLFAVMLVHFWVVALDLTLGVRRRLI